MRADASRFALKYGLHIWLRAPLNEISILVLFVYTIDLNACHF
jgi:hypothetical protein